MPTRRPTKAQRHRTEAHTLALQVGQKVKAFRVARGRVFEDFAESTGLGRGYISELERGLVVPSIDTMSRLADELGVTTLDLLAGIGLRDRLYEATRDLPERELQHLLDEAERAAARIKDSGDVG